jgi:hypothetical protein
METKQIIKQRKIVCLFQSRTSIQNIYTFATSYRKNEISVDDEEAAYMEFNGKIDCCPSEIPQQKEEMFCLP